jgi:cytochrome c oxidase subunit III
MEIVSKQHIDEPTPTLSMNPHKFAMWLFIISIVMIFAALTSAYLVRRADGNWREFELPSILWFNTAILIVSSATMHWSYLSAKKNNLRMLKVAISITTILGVAFLVGQYTSWAQLVESGVFFADSKTPSGSFVYVLTGVHGFHLISGIVFLLIVLISSFQYKIHSKNLTRIEICATYWHFLDALWVYLFVFLLINHS